MSVQVDYKECFQACLYMLTLFFLYPLPLSSKSVNQWQHLWSINFIYASSRSSFTICRILLWPLDERHLICVKYYCCCYSSVFSGFYWNLMSCQKQQHPENLSATVPGCSADYRTYTVPGNYILRLAKMSVLFSLWKELLFRLYIKRLG